MPVMWPDYSATFPLLNPESTIDLRDNCRAVSVIVPLVLLKLISQSAQPFLSRNRQTAEVKYKSQFL